MGAAPDRPYVSRGGLKLRHALDQFGIDPAGLVCADLGCSTGGFTDCLLRAGAGRVFAVDTAYGQLAWTLRSDPRVTVLERSNALHTEPPSGAALGADLVVIDLGWTRQDRAIPAALRWLKPGGRIISLVKPHYEVERAELDRLAVRGVLPEDNGARIAESVGSKFPALGVTLLGLTKSPVRGGKPSKRADAEGNAEWLALLERARP
ncbi:MAG TPA: SAM-dependent methyltransferase [Phycisphaerales bacterium]|nr:SAM-dependent methyltransferase [Phycisphaerales bacterium]